MFGAYARTKHTAEDHVRLFADAHEGEKLRLYYF
jgi:hypothetical protein